MRVLVSLGEWAGVMWLAEVGVECVTGCGRVCVWGSGCLTD